MWILPSYSNCPLVEVDEKTLLLGTIELSFHSFKYIPQNVRAGSHLFECAKIKAQNVIN